MKNWRRSYILKQPEARPAAVLAGLVLLVALLNLCLGAEPVPLGSVLRVLTGQESGTVVTVFQKGYKLGDKIIRHATVVVAE